MPPSARREALGDVPEEVRASDHRCHGTSAAHSGFLLSLVIAPAFVPLIGCGQGELAGAVARRGYEIVAIDPPASDGDIFEPVSLEQFAGPAPSTRSWRAGCSTTFPT